MTLVLPPAAFGIAGNTSAQALDRIGAWAMDDIAGVNSTPDLAGSLIGVNDPAAGISQASTQQNIEAMIMAAKFGAYGDPTVSAGAYVAAQTSLPQTGRVGQRYVVMSDTSVTGGAAAWSASHRPTVTGTVSGVTVWEYRHNRAGEGGWGRIATPSTIPTHVGRQFVVAAGYKNYFTNGSDTSAAGASGRRDTLSTPEPYYAQVRAAQQAAVTAHKGADATDPWVIYVDLYALHKALIQGGAFQGASFAAGTVPDFSGGASYDATKDWHFTSGNQHHGMYGHQLVALAVMLSVANFPKWIDVFGARSSLNVKIIGDSQTDYQGGYCRAFYTWAPTLGRMLQAHLDAA